MKEIFPSIIKILSCLNGIGFVILSRKKKIVIRIYMNKFIVFMYEIYNLLISHSLVKCKSWRCFNLFFFPLNKFIFLNGKNKSETSLNYAVLNHNHIKYH